ncbi:hypothetical protein PIB30_044557 [Stylosanthes scabra]|uniref:Uncharacterized protein n=1 Tax=Stylosanthes scabra TaxID=79078 RepID=A0ABU6UEJ4_9FABA|nr:hypothetical protein [Stylosanthes scabra]
MTQGHVWSTLDMKAMIDASSGGALMNKMPKEAWELIETVADANQHFNRRVTSKGVYEVAPSDSTVLAKSLVDIAAMLKEIKEGQQHSDKCIGSSSTTKEWVSFPRGKGA